MTALTPELESIKAKQKATWSAGDYGVVAKNLEASALDFLARIPVEPGSRVLDVACGTGQLAFPAARAGARVAGIDIAPNLIEQARARADFEGVDIQFSEGDAEALPYGDASFDLVISLIGAMFAPRPDVVAPAGASCSATGRRRDSSAHSSKRSRSTFRRPQGSRHRSSGETRRLCARA